MRVDSLMESRLTASGVFGRGLSKKERGFIDIDNNVVIAGRSRV